jgi:putative transposase
MARPLRIEFPGAIYHITSRGNAHGIIFNDEQDRQVFLAILGSLVTRYHWICHAYCLMDNHYHLLVETPEANLARGMRQLNGVYTQAFNRRHSRVGHLLQGRYKAIVVEKESYLLELCRYIVLNPVAAGMVGDPGDWEWSSYQAAAGLAPRPNFLTTEWVLSQFGHDRLQAHQRYIAFVSQGIGAPSPWENLRGVLLGREDFAERFEPHLSDQQDQTEIPRKQRLAHRPPLENLFSSDDRINRTDAAAQAHGWGYTLQEIARFCGVHYSTVSRMIKRAEG